MSIPQVNLFSGEFNKVINQDVQFLQLEAAADVKENSPKKEEWASSSATKSCSYCRMQFTDTTQQREHYKLDWHRYNLKQSLLSREPITEEEFNERTDDISSISGSESSDKEDNLESIATAQGKVFLKNKEGIVVVLYRCLLFEKKEELEDKILLRRLQACTLNSQWTLLMLGGGHFAGGVFQGTNPILHKTFHCYTVRAGQGGAQSSRDNRNASSQPRSAGASLRRFNENALIQHVKDIVETWKDEIAKSSLIMYRAAGPYNRAVLFGGKVPLLVRSDTRLRAIPFSTRRATFTELQRVHSLLTNVQIYDSTEEVLKQFPKQESIDSANKRTKPKLSNINRAKSREHIERPLPGTACSSSGSDSETEEVSEWKTNEQEISFEESLQSFGDSLSPEQRKQGQKKHKKVHKSKNKRAKEREAARRKEIYEVVSSGDLEKLQEILNNTSLNAGEEIENVRTANVTNEVLDEKGNSLLHVAAIHEKTDVISFLLNHEADPCSKNDKQQTPYTCTQNKCVREVFKEFAKEHPDRYNYNKAQIPINIVSQEEQAEKKKLLRTIKKEKEKEKKKQNAIKKQEDLEKERFLNLSDREKRALAAERRMLNVSGSVISRCFLCASDMSGKVPFEYSGNRFCSVECLKAHRMKTPVVLSS